MGERTERIGCGLCQVGKRKQEKQKAFKERQEQIRRDREYDEAMKQINAIRTARAIETLLDVAKEIKKEKDSKGI